MDGVLISQDDFFCLGEFTLSLRDRSLNRSDEKVFLRPKAFEVLLLLVQNRGRIVSKEKLLDTVWSDVEVTEASLAHTIHELRQFLGDSPTQPRYIQTVPRVGYRLADWAAEPASGRARPVRAASSRVNGLLLPLLALISMVGLASWGHWSVPGSEPISERPGASAASSVGLILPKVEVTSADPRITELAHTVYNLILARISERTSGIALFSPTPVSSSADFEALVGRLEAVSELQMSLLAESETVTLVVRLVDVRRGRIHFAATETGKWDEGDRLGHRLAEGLAARLIPFLLAWSPPPSSPSGDVTR